MGYIHFFGCRYLQFHKTILLQSYETYNRKKCISRWYATATVSSCFKSIELVSGFVLTCLAQIDSNRSEDQSESGKGYGIFTEPSWFTDFSVNTSPMRCSTNHFLPLVSVMISPLIFASRSSFRRAHPEAKTKGTNKAM